MLTIDDIPILDSIEILEGKIVEISYKENSKITTSNIANVIELFYNITGNEKLGRLIIIGKDVVITNAARKVIVEENKRNKDFIIAEAIVVNSFYQKIKVNFYLSLIKKIYPTQCFTDPELAKEWLRRQIKIRI